ncbi:MAG: iron-sulfur cluster assembly accessory protein [Armatimonadota bacterium]
MSRSGRPVEFPITLTPRAIDRVKAIQAREGRPHAFLRVGVRGGGCSGLAYVARLDEERTTLDLSKDFDGLEVVVDSKSARFLAGTTLDFTGELIGGGFRFDNPNAERGCGCGTSFTPRAL